MSFVINKEPFVLNVKGKGKSKKRKIELANATPLSFQNKDDEVIIIEPKNRTVKDNEYKE